MSRLLPSLEALRAENLRRHFGRFIRASWHVIEPTMPLIDGWHIDAMADHLQAVSRGQIQNLLINVPPGHAKSLIVSVMWPAWMWTWKPSWRGLFAAYAGELALRDSVKCRQLIESEWYQQRFPVALASDQNVKSFFQNTDTGFRMSLSVGGKATGFRGDAVAVDDPLNAKEAPSALKREEAIFWWDKVMSSRRNDLSRGPMVIIMQRLHEDDLAGHVLRKGTYEHLCLPSEYDPKRRSKTFYVRNPVPLGHEGPQSRREEFWSDPRTEKGQLLFPALFPKTALAQAKQDLGGDGYAAQHDQNPVPLEGGMFKRHWWRRYDVLPKELESLGEWAASLDCTFKKTTDSDFVVLQVWARFRANRYLVWSARARRDMPETCALLARMKTLFPQVGLVLVEEAANGDAVLQTMRDKVPGLVGVRVHVSKEARASAVTPFVEAGNVWIPAEYGSVEVKWETDQPLEDPVKAFVDECGAFPKGRNDDQVDAMSMMLERWRVTPEADIEPVRGFLSRVATDRTDM